MKKTIKINIGGIVFQLDEDAYDKLKIYLDLIGRRFGSSGEGKEIVEDIERRIADAKQKVTNGEASPLLFFMELKLMDLQTLAAYTGFWKWQIKRHLLPNVFNKLSDKKLKKYAGVFDVSVSQLKAMEINEA